MRVCFGDSSYFIALLNQADAHHATARAVSRAEEWQIVTTSFVLLELADALSRPAWRPHATAMIRAMQTSADYRVIPSSQQLFDAGLEFFSRRRDKSWSLTDCTSFIVMTREGITDVLTADHHFEQAGFTTLLT